MGELFYNKITGRKLFYYLFWIRKFISLQIADQNQNHNVNYIFMKQLYSKFQQISIEMLIFLLSLYQWIMFNGQKKRFVALELITNLSKTTWCRPCHIAANVGQSRILPTKKKIQNKSEQNNGPKLLYNHWKYSKMASIYILF